MKKLLLPLLLLLLLCAPALAEEARDITGDCALAVSAHKSDLPLMTDGDYYTYWACSKNGYVEITAPEGQRVHGLYLSWGKYITKWEIQAQDAAGSWQPVYTTEEEFYNQYIPLTAGYSMIRLVNKSTDGHEMAVSELHVLGEGAVPAWVQQWHTFEGKTDLVLLVTDPGDEYLFFGGLLPTYIAQGKEIMVCEIVNTIAAYKSQMLDGLWYCGMTNYPYMAYFRPNMTVGMQAQYDTWSEVQFVRHVSRIVRMYKPDVLVTHAQNGEGIDGGHKVCADASLRSLTTAMDDKYDVGYGYANWGNWKVKKIYLHQTGENQTVLDFDVPLDFYGGKTADEIARDAYSFQDYQEKSLKGRGIVYGQGVADGTSYGLAFSQVGEDTGIGDLFENIDPE